MASFKAFRRFLTAILHHWIALLTGGVLMAGVGIYEHRASTSVPWFVYAGIIELTFVVACFLAFKDQYKRAETLQETLDHAGDPVGLVNANTNHQAISVEYERAEPFERRTVFPAGNARFEVYIRIKNNGNGFLSECIVSLLDIHPKPDHDVYTILTPITALQKGEHRYVAVAGFNEHQVGSQEVYNNAVTFAFATGAFHGGFTTLPPPTAEAPAILTIEATALECGPVRKRFKMWVGDGRRLCMASLD